MKYSNNQKFQLMMGALITLWCAGMSANAKASDDGFNGLSIPVQFGFNAERKVALTIDFTHHSAQVVKVYGFNYRGLYSRNKSNTDLPQIQRSLLAVMNVGETGLLAQSINIPQQYSHIVIDYGQANQQPQRIPQSNAIVIRQ